jgi:hypothetical protein
MKASRWHLAAMAGVAIGFMLVGVAAAQEAPAAPARPAAAVAPVPEPPVPTAEVVIVWAGGAPDAPPLPAPDAGAVDAVTHATDPAGNVRQMAEALGKELEATGRTVLIITADGCRDPRTIMRAKAVVLASPDYFGMPVWQMVRFIDDTLYRIWRARAKTDVLVATSIATTDRVLGILQQAVRASGGQPVDGAVIRASRTSEEERATMVKQLAERLVAGLQPQPVPAPAAQPTPPPAPAQPAAAPAAR